MKNRSTKTNKNQELKKNKETLLHFILFKGTLSRRINIITNLYLAPIKVILYTAVLRNRIETPVGSTPYLTPYQKVPGDNVLTAQEHGIIFDINTWGLSFTRCSRVTLVVEQLEHSNNDATVTGAALSTETAVWNPTLTALLTGAASVSSVYSGLQTMETESIRYV